MRLQETRDIGRIHAGCRRCNRGSRRGQRGEPGGFRLPGRLGLPDRFAPGRFDLLLGIGGGLLLGLLDLGCGSIGLLPCLGKLKPGVVKLPLGLFGDAPTFLLEIAFGLFRHLQFGLLRAPRRLFLELFPEIFGFLPGLLLGLTPDRVGSLRWRCSAASSLPSAARARSA